MMETVRRRKTHNSEITWVLNISIYLYSGPLLCVFALFLSLFGVSLQPVGRCLVRPLGQSAGTPGREAAILAGNFSDAPGA